MILEIGTILRVKAMALAMTRAELLERLDVPEYTLEAALRGEEINPWDGHHIFEGVEAWDIKQGKGAA